MKNSVENAPAWRPEFDAYEPSLVKATDACSRFIAEITANPTGKVAAGRSPFAQWQAVPAGGARWLTLSGPTGSGKTMLARQVFAAANTIYPWRNGSYQRDPRNESDRRPECVWLTEADMKRRCVEGKEWDLPHYLSNDWIVVLDDLGTERDPSGFMADMLYKLLSLRLAKWTVFTTNYPLQVIADRIDARVASRLVRDANEFVAIKAGDYALRKLSA